VKTFDAGVLQNNFQKPCFQKKKSFSSNTVFKNPFKKPLQGSQFKNGLIGEYQSGTICPNLPLGREGTEHMETNMSPSSLSLLTANNMNILILV
jgi:hypothetical protein